MRSLIKNIFITAATLTAVFGFAFTALAAGNIDSTDKYSQFIGTDIDNNGTDDLINWSPTNGGITVSDTKLSGYAWGESVGWINLDPSQSGVKNTCSGQLSGYAWGENAGWINFEATNATIDPNIDIATGKITGQVWSENYGWIELSSTEPGFTGLTTTWRPSANCTDPIDPDQDDDEGGGQTPTLKIIKKVIGGPASVSDFIISIMEGGVLLNGSPFVGSADGSTVIINTNSDRTFVITEQSSGEYTTTFSGDCSALGIVTFNQGEESTKTCTITSTYNPYKVYVCKDPAALNYDASPNTFAQNSLCKYKSADGNVYGCKDSLALNYNQDPNVLQSNDLCKYPAEVNGYGCKDTTALNYDADPNIIGNNSLCTYTTDGFACKDERANNYDANPELKADNVRCVYPAELYACKDPSALNYNADESTVSDNNLCSYPKKDWINKWILLGLAVAGVASTVPGVTARGGTMLSTFVWGRKKIKGVVFDSNTKEPLDPVYVSVIDLATNQEVKNQLTNMEGRFGFVLPKGHYRITASKTHYAFPSAHLAGRVSDEVYDRMYFGEPFTVENERQVVSMNIPLDPIGTDWNQVEKHRTSFIHYLIKGQTKYAWIFNALFVLGFLASIMITYFYPSWWNYVITAIYVVLGLIQVYGYGPVYAGKVTKNGIPLGGAIVRVWSAGLNHEVAKRVTEASGFYYAIVPKADYYVTIDQKNPDGTFTKVFTSTVFHANHGCIDKDFKI